jgi:hypothetical protein
MSNRLNDQHNKGEQDVARPSEHGGITDNLIRIIGGETPMTILPMTSKNETLTTVAFAMQKSEPSPCKAPALKRAPFVQDDNRSLSL